MCWREYGVPQPEGGKPLCDDSLSSRSASLALISCQREKQEVPAVARTVAVYGDAARQSTLQPGGRSPRAFANPYHGEAYAISEGSACSAGITAPAATRMAAAASVRR